MANRILVVDDHDVVRQGVIQILKTELEWEIVGEASDGVEALVKTQALDPDLIILDVTMPRKDGLEVLAELTKMKVRSRIIILTMHESHDLSEALQRAGASGYVVKNHAARDLIPAAQTIFGGGRFFPDVPSRF